jgi:hypothetical protein
LETEKAVETTAVQTTHPHSGTTDQEAELHLHNGMTALEAELLPLAQETKGQEADSILVQEMTALETTALEVDSTLVQETTDQDSATEALVQHQNPATTIVQALDPTLIMSTVITTGVTITTATMVLATMVQTRTITTTTSLHALTDHALSTIDI